MDRWASALIITLVAIVIVILIMVAISILLVPAVVNLPRYTYAKPPNAV